MGSFPLTDSAELDCSDLAVPRIGRVAVLVDRVAVVVAAAGAVVVAGTN